MSGDVREVHRGYTFKLYPTGEQERKFLQFSGVCRLVYNISLEQRKNHWRGVARQTGRPISFAFQCLELTELRRQFEFVSNVPQSAQKNALKALDMAFQRFFRGQSEFPRPRKRGVRDSFTFDGRSIKVAQNGSRWGFVRLPRLGVVRFRDTRAFPPGAKLTSATVSHTPLGWHVSIGIKYLKEVLDNGRTCGIDRGVTVPLAVSDGTSFLLPDRISKLEKIHRKAQRVVARRKRGSNRHMKAVKRASAIKSRQARVRRSWGHAVSNAITAKYGGVIVERLITKNMTRSAKGSASAPGRNVAAKSGLNREILNVGWHQIEMMLAYKAVRFGKVAPQYTSQTCSTCGYISKESRKSQAHFQCVQCNNDENADLNAAKNILARGIAQWPGEHTGHQVISPVKDVEGSSYAPDEALTQRKSGRDARQAKNPKNRTLEGC